MDEREQRDDAQDEVKLPDERVEDLEPDVEETSDVKGGGFPTKWQGES